MDKGAYIIPPVGSLVTLNNLYVENLENFMSIYNNNTFQNLPIFGQYYTVRGHLYHPVHGVLIGVKFFEFHNKPIFISSWKTLVEPVYGMLWFDVVQLPTDLSKFFTNINKPK